MAELATVARPYAEAMFKASASSTLADQLDQVAQVATHEQLRQFADNPKVSAQNIFDVITATVGVSLEPKMANFLRTIIDNGRLSALAEIATQYRTLFNRQSGVSEARIVSAFDLDAAQLAQLTATLEQRFGRRLQAKVEVDNSLIGGVRVEVGDEVLDTSIKARLERMRTALMS